MTISKIRVVGAGLAGCEAALQLAKGGVLVELYEMKPHKRTPAQVSDHFAELVCSNSFRSNNVHNAVGLIKEEMRKACGELIQCADEARVPAGDALAVDRVLFAQAVESRIRSAPNIKVVSEEITHLWDDEQPCIVATGPLTSDGLAQQICALIGQERLSFYDAIAPIVDAQSIDMEHAYFQSRWDKGEGQDYLNCPMNKAEYEQFVAMLKLADQAVAKEFENLHYFEGCLPIEEMAKRGDDTLRFGPFKPVGLSDPKTGLRAHAVVQLRKEDIYGSSFNLVGCQTRMKQGMQREVFGLIPALRKAQFLRYGAIHRNTYLDAPAVLDDSMRIQGCARPIYFAGQITGVEGYVESMASGLIVSRLLQGHRPPPKTTALGGLYRHTRGSLRHDAKQAYSPSNVTWAMLPPLPDLPKRASKDDKRAALVARAMSDLMAWQSDPAAHS